MVFITWIVLQGKSQSSVKKAQWKENSQNTMTGTFLAISKTQHEERHQAWGQMENWLNEIKLRSNTDMMLSVLCK